MFQCFGENPPDKLNEIFGSFYGNDALFKLVMEEKLAIASFHFGLPEPQKISAMKEPGIYQIATATNLDEALAIEQVGFDAVIAQGYEAGSHCGMFDENAVDLRLSLVTLLKLIRKQAKIPVIAAGGIMDGHDICAFIRLGASTVQIWAQLLLPALNHKQIAGNSYWPGGISHHDDKTLFWPSGTCACQSVYRFYRKCAGRRHTPLPLCL